jgi:hypothetical protein
VNWRAIFVRSLRDLRPLGIRTSAFQEDEKRSLTAPLSFAKLIFLPYSYCNNDVKKPRQLYKSAGASPLKALAEHGELPPFRRIASTSYGGNGYFVIPGFVRRTSVIFGWVDCVGRIFVARFAVETGVTAGCCG